MSRGILASVGTLLVVCATMSAGANVAGAASGPGYDSAAFTAPDGAVQFYVFSPQWSGSPSYCRLDSRYEVLVGRHTEKTTDAGQTAISAFETVRARNGSYGRSWVDTTTSLNARLAFGIRYRDARSLAAYRHRYLLFKESLRQFAD